MVVSILKMIIFKSSIFFIITLIIVLPLLSPSGTPSFKILGFLDFFFQFSIFLFYFLKEFLTYFYLSIGFKSTYAILYLISKSFFLFSEYFF